MEKKYTATQRYVQTTPRKLRLVADAVKKTSPVSAIEVLPYSQKRAAGPLLKVVKTAVANAKQAGANEAKLVFSEIQITQGPALKRGIAVSRGQWHPIKKRMSHIRVVLTERQSTEGKGKSAKVEKDLKKIQK